RNVLSIFDNRKPRRYNAGELPEARIHGKAFAVKIAYTGDEPLAIERLKIGRIRYANLFPIFHMLERAAGSAAYEFVEGVPSALNKLLREGMIDISPSSSVEYLRHGETYTLLDGHSISSFGPVGSILLFSRRPIETLDGRTVLASSQSETSVALLDIVLRKFFDLTCPVKPSGEPLSKAIESHSAYLLIGDDALREAPRWPKLHIYDLGEIWYKTTGLPFVFALWIARKDCGINNPHAFGQFRVDLDFAKTEGLKNLKTIAKNYPAKNLLSEEEFVAYWQGISYDFGEEHKKGLALFRRYAAELKLL
ncbi:MAG TPA: menaquinone biosynthesis protein, partial [Thermodesulfovibrionales bacterium]|nr:menaquinone biosynthesis protein [Thermodesulfovibrionales bacterium]